jgi:hypothetical protein
MTYPMRHILSAKHDLPLSITGKACFALLLL